MTADSRRMALVHERLTDYAGSERVVEQLANTWPEYSIYAPLGSARAVPGVDPHCVRVDPNLNRVYESLLRGRSYAPLMPFFPRSFARLPLEDASAVVISHHAFALSAAHAAPDGVPVIAYVHSPARWAWDPVFREGEASGAPAELALTALARLARKHELAALPRLDAIVANSTEVADRIRLWWNRGARVVHPPVDVSAFAPKAGTRRGDFFLLAGRLVPYKRPDLAIRAAERAGVDLVVIGNGRMEALCRRLAGPRTRFLGHVDQSSLVEHYRTARALLMPGVEDFGIVPVEAMACGTPVLAVGAGGVLDTVNPGVTGELVPAGDDEVVVERLAAAMKNWSPERYDQQAIRAWAERFSPERFRTEMRAVLDEQN